MTAKNTSEILRLLEQISAEHEAAERGLYSYALVSRHAFLTARMERIANHFESLACITGSKDEAMALIAETLE